MKYVDYLLNAIIAIIGIYMIIAYAGSSIPPLLSGIAFVLIATVSCMRKKSK